MYSDESNRITITSLKAETGVTDDQLNQRCSVKHLNGVAPHVGNYTKFATCFSLPPAIIAGINTNLLLSFQQKTEAVFEWWSSNTRNATYRNFIQACIVLSEGDVARRMSELCAKGKKAKKNYNRLADQYLFVH